MTARFDSGLVPEAGDDDEAYVFAYRGRRLLVHEDGPKVRVPRLGEIREIAARDAAYEPLRRLYLGTFDGLQVFAAEMAAESAGTGAPDARAEAYLRDAAAPEGMAFHGLRGLYARLDEALFPVAGRAIQIVDWDRDHAYCSRCRAPMEPQESERSKKCPECALVAYPRLSPAVIVLVERGPEMLLARSPHFPPGMYSTLAGFVEPGETLEETAVREIEEEVGVLVGDIRYFGSQPWPFPNSLMLGFFARYESGDIRVKEDEIEDAGWFTADALPKIPPKISIARALIDAFLERQMSP